MALLMAGVFTVLKPWQQDEWRGLFYPNGGINVRTGGSFETKEGCLEWARGQARGPRDRYECGKNCNVRKGINVDFGLCEEVVQS